MRTWFAMAVAVALVESLAFSAEPPTPFGAVPDARQLAWHETEFYGFVHFNIKTFTDKEWGYGDESPPQAPTNIYLADDSLQRQFP